MSDRPRLHVASEKGVKKRGRVDSVDDRAVGLVKAPRLGPLLGRTLRGLTEGRIKLRDEVDRPRCLVMGIDFPSWLCHISSLGFKLDRVLLKHPRFLEQVYLVCGTDAAVWSCPDWESVGVSWPYLGKEITCFLEGRATGRILGMLMGLGVENIFSTSTP